MNVIKCYCLIFYPTGASQVKTIAGELTDLTSPVVSTALKVNQDSGAGHSQLHNIGKQWDLKAQQLKTAVDEIISPVEFTAATGILTIMHHQ